MYPRCKAGKRADETMQCDVMLGVGGRDEGSHVKEIPENERSRTPEITHGGGCGSGDEGRRRG